MVNLELYKIFVIVAEQKNITKASEKLNISQPAVTKHIKNLENQLNMKLFERNKGMFLTEKGQEIFNKIEPIINNLLKIEADFLNVRDINFGTYNTMNSKILGECINKYYQKNRETNINLTTNKIEELISMLEKSKLDIILSKKINENVYDENKIKYIKLGEIEEVLIVNKNSNLREKNIDIKDLKHEIIYIPRNDSKSIVNFINQLEKEGIKNIKRIDSSTMLKILEKGEGVGLITKAYINEELEEEKIVILKTKFNIEKSEIGIYIRKDENFKQLKDFIKIVKERFEDI